MSRTLQDIIDELGGNDLPYGHLVVEALQKISDELDEQGELIDVVLDPTLKSNKENK